MGSKHQVVATLHPRKKSWYTTNSRLDGLGFLQKNPKPLQGITPQTVLPTN